MLRRILLLGALLLVPSTAVADCYADPFSKPTDMFGQTFTCDDGKTLRYERSPLGDSITNDDTGSTYYADPLTNRGDEYRSIFGRDFDGLTLQRNGVLGDSITDPLGDPSYTDEE